MIANTSTGTPTKAADLTIGARVLIGIDTKKVLNVTVKGDKTWLKAQLSSGRTGYFTFLSTRTLFVY